MIIKFFIIFLLSILFIRIIRNNAAKLGLIDIPNKRSEHVKHTASGAGIGFYLAILLVFSVFYLDVMLSYACTFSAIFLVYIVGVMDDHHDTAPNTKFIIIALSTVLLYFDDILINNLGSFFGFELSLGWFALPFTMFAVVGFTNALNLIDGLDGLSASVSIVILGSFFYVGYMHDDFFMMLLAGAFISTLLGFLLFNWCPASIFMGDSGSLTLGFVISLLAIKSLAYLPTISILFIAAVPILDTVIIMTRRKLRGRKMFCADRCHMHHILRHFFAEDTRKTVLFLAILQAVFSLTGLQLEKNIDEGVLLVLFIFNIVLLYMFLSAMIQRQQRDC